jgi:hypothetical protein
MRRLLVISHHCVVGSAAALLLLFWSADAVLAASIAPDVGSPATAAPVTCDSQHSAVPPSDGEGSCGASSRTPDEVAQARAYVVQTADPGYTMMLQGPELAIDRLHPEFVVRLANAIREARAEGLPSVGVFSAYRPPAFGIGGFHDKFKSLHSYGLAVDMHGIGQSGSAQAQLWHEIAARNGVVCPYGPRDPAEWNHCQPTSLKMILAANPLRETITAAGPRHLETMFEAGNVVIESMVSAAESLSRASPTLVHVMEAATDHAEPKLELAANRGTKRTARAEPKLKLAANSRAKRIARAAIARVAMKSTRHARTASQTRA